jgi:hypothetical protein
MGLWRSVVARRCGRPKVAGSSPAWSTHACLAQRAERPLESREVLRSIRRAGTKDRWSSGYLASFSARRGPVRSRHGLRITCGSSPTGRAPVFQTGMTGFESPLPLAHGVSRRRAVEAQTSQSAVLVTEVPVRFRATAPRGCSSDRKNVASPRRRSPVRTRPATLNSTRPEPRR